MLSDLKKDFSTSAAVAGGIALVATFTGPVLIVVQAATAGGLSQSLLSTWIFAVSIGAGLLSLWLSLRYKMPVIGAWSTPGVALLITGLTQFSFSDVIGCYLILALLISLLGVTGLFSKIMKLVPSHLMSAMIAGVLFQFCTKIFQSLQLFPSIVLPIIIAYIFSKRIIPRYAVALSLFTGLIFSITEIKSIPHNMSFNLVNPEITFPTFSANALIGLGLPLFLLALTQLATSIHILKNAGYDISSRAVVGFSGIISIPLALLGSSGTNPAAIVGALCASSECHQDPKRRYISGVISGLGYIGIGIFGASIISLFSLLPNGLTTTIAGLALLGTLVSSLATSLSDESHRESSIITFIVTVSGMSFLGLGSALWGLVAGIIFSIIVSWKLPVKFSKIFYGQAKT
jgi:benzoate membrane transport protein